MHTIGRDEDEEAGGRTKEEEREAGKRLGGGGSKSLPNRWEVLKKFEKVCRIDGKCSTNN